MSGKFNRDNHKASKLTPGQVNLIREQYASRTKTQGQLARDFGISAVQIGRIVRWESWTDMPEIDSPEEMEEGMQRILRVQREVDLADKMGKEVEEARREGVEGETKADRLLEELEVSEGARERAKRLLGED